MAQVGDIVYAYKSRELETAVITQIDGAAASLLFADGSHGIRSDKRYKETGKHIDIERVLRQIV